MFVRKRARSLDVLDIVLLEQKFDSLGQASDGGFLRFHHLFEVELDIADFDAAVLDVVLDQVVDLRVVEQRFRRDAAHIQTCAAQRTALFDACDLYTSRSH